MYMGVGGEKGETSGRAPDVTEFGSRRKHRRAQRSFSVITLLHYQCIISTLSVHYDPLQITESLVVVTVILRVI